MVTFESGKQASSKDGHFLTDQVLAYVHNIGARGVNRRTIHLSTFQSRTMEDVSHGDGAGPPCPSSIPVEPIVRSSRSDPSKKGWVASHLAQIAVLRPQ